MLIPHLLSHFLIIHVITTVESILAWYGNLHKKQYATIVKYYTYKLTYSVHRNSLVVCS